MSDQNVIHVNLDPFVFLLGVQAGLILTLVLIALKDKKSPAKIAPIRKSHAEKEESE
jgi:hypothetical protein